jgi:hypothetical protein
MFRSFAGFKAHYHYLTLLAVAEFDEWKVLVYGPDVTIHGRRQFGEAKAKDHAANIAKSYVHQRKQEELPELPELQWTSTTTDDWLAFND